MRDYIRIDNGYNERSCCVVTHGATDSAFGAFDTDLPRAIVETRSEPVSLCRLLDAAYDSPGIVLQDGIAARDSGQWAYGFKRTRQATQFERIALKSAGRSGLCPLRQGQQSFPQIRNAALRLVGSQHGCGMPQ